MLSQRTTVVFFLLSLGASIGACRAPSAPPTGGTLTGAAAPEPDARIIAQWGGAVHGLVVDGARAYFGHGMRVVVADVRRPSAPRVLGESPVMAGSVQDIALAGHLIVARVGDGVQVVDIGRPSRPVLRGRLAIGEGVAGVAARGRTAYVLAETGSLHIVDLGRPDALVQVAVVDGLPGGDIAVSDTTAYVVGGELAAVDVRRPERPTISGRAPVTGTMIRLDGDLAYVLGKDPPVPGVMDDLGGPYRLNVVDVRRPSRMRSLHTTTSGFSYISDMAIDGGRLYTVESGATAMGSTQPCCAVHVTDYSRPVAPEAMGVGQVALAAGGLGDLAAVGDRLYALSVRGGLHVIDVSAPDAPVVLGTLPIVSAVNDVAADGGRVFAITGQPNGGFLTNDNRFLDAFDLTDLAAPRLDRLALTGLAYRVARSDGRVVLRGGGGLTIVDASRSGELDRAGAYASESAHPMLSLPSNRQTEVVVRGDDAWFTDLLHVGGFDGAVEHVDISDPRQPRMVERIDFNMAPIALALAGDHLFVAERPEPDAVRDTQSGVRIFAVGGVGGAAVTAATEVGYLPLPGKAIDVAVSGDGDRLYVLDGALRIFDLGAPVAPGARGSLDFGFASPKYAYQLALDGTTVYVAIGGDEPRVLVVEAADSDAPRVLDEIDGLPGSIEGMTVADGGVVVALGEGGMVLLRRTVD